MIALMNTVLMRGYIAVSDFKNRMMEERGQDLIEYALLGGLIAAALLAAAALVAYTGAVTGMAGGIKDCVDFDNLTDCGFG